MQPVQDILNRIRWDPESRRHRYAIGFYDRLAGRVLVVPFTDVSFPPDDHYGFLVIDDQGAAHSIPYHRVRDVYRNGELIWHRKGPASRTRRE